MHLLCPRCGHLMELIGDVGEVVFCPSCRSGVQIDRGVTAGVAPQEPAPAESASEPGTNRPGAGADTVDDLLRTCPQAPAAAENRGRQGPSGKAAAETRAPLAGPRVPGYELQDLIGRGGMGVVYRARQLGLNRIVALKMIRSGAHAGPEDLARFRTEAEAAARLRHPNIVQIYEVGEHDDLPYFSLEFCDGGSLAQRLAGNPLPPAEAARLTEALAGAMHAAHQQGVIHRDLKPSNVLLSPRVGEGEGQTARESGDARSGPGSSTPRLTDAWIPKVSDFGLAKQLDIASGQTQTGQVLGTPSYMAPEQAAGRTREVGPAADVYALGAILYECLTGRPPFLGASPRDTLEQVCTKEPVPPRQLQPHTPRDLETVCLKCLHKDPKKRYASALALAEDLRRFLRGEPILARPVSALERGIAWTRRRPAVAGLSAAVVLVSVLGFSLVTVNWLAAVDAHEAAETAHKLAEERAENEAAALRKEKRAHTEAEKARQQEANARSRAETAQRSEAAQRHDAETSLYTMSIALAYREWSANNLARSEEILQQCKPAFRGWEWQYLNRLCRSELLTLPGKGQTVAFSPDGRHLLTTAVKPGGNPRLPAQQEELHVWDLVTGNRLRSVSLPVSGLKAWSADGRRLAGFCVAPDRRGPLAPGSIKLWDLDGKELLSLPGAEGVAALAFGADGKVLTAVTGRGTVKTWGLASRKELRSARINDRLTGNVFSIKVALSPDGKQVAGATEGGIVKIWDAATVKELAVTAMQPREVSITYAIVFSPDGSRLAVLDNSGVVQVYDTATGRQLLALPGTSGVAPSTLAFSPDGRRLIAESGENALRVWDVTTGRELLTLRVEVGELAGVHQLVFSPDGFRIATIHSDTVHVWDVTTGQDARTVPRNGGMVKRLAFSPDGRLLASACEQALNEIGLVRINVYDTLTGGLVALFTGHKKDARGVAFLPDGKRMVSGDGGGAVKVWEVRSGRVLLDLRGPSRGVKDVAVSPDGTRLVAGGIVKYQPPPGKTRFNRREARVESQVKVWDANTGEEVRALSLPGEVERVLITSDGKRLMASTWTGTVTTWDLASGKELRSLPFEEGVLAISPDGGRVATARFRLTGADRKTPPPTEIKVWDSKTGKLLRVMRRRFSDAVSLAWSPDGKRLAYSGGVRDRGIHIWEAATGHETFTLHGTRFAMSALAFSPEGSRLAAGGLDPVVRIWDAKPVTEADRGARRAALVAALPQWHLDAGEQALAAGQRFAALFHLDRAVQALPNHPQPLLARAGAHAEWGNWDKAERDFARALRMGAPFSAWYHCALVRLKRQDTQGYRDLCTRLLARADRVTKPQDLNTLVWTCALGPDGVAEPTRLVELQEKITRAAPRNYALANTLGAALYRAGRLQEAVKQLEVAVRLHGRGGFAGDWLFLAMAHHRLGNKEGKEWLERSVKWMNQFLPTVPRSGRRQPWGAVLELRLLRQEAEKVLKAPPGPGPPGS